MVNDGGGGCEDRDEDEGRRGGDKSGVVVGWSWVVGCLWGGRQFIGVAIVASGEW